MGNKRLFGQYFTITNPFNTVGFYKWLESIPNYKDEIILEPFAGGNNIPRMIRDEGIIPKNKWKCFDIAPAHNTCSDFEIIKRDTIKDFPAGYRIAITNPPYLSKNSATRRGLSYPNTEYDDLYKLCLDLMLKNCDYVAAIIPETFITSGLFHNRIYSIVSLTCKMFDDTDCPVCLAMFSPEHNDSFSLYRMDEYIGLYSELRAKEIVCSSEIKWRFNNPDGEIGIWCIDGTKYPTIHFGDGNLIDKEKIKASSRSITRVSGLPTDIDLNSLIAECNSILNIYRQNTKDVFMASFKGLRNDGYYRRRLDFATARNILNQAVQNIRSESSDKSSVNNFMPVMYRKGGAYNMTYIPQGGIY